MSDCTRTTSCALCGKTITTVSNWRNDMFYENIHKIKWYTHLWKVHKKKSIELAIAIVKQAICIPLKIIAYIVVFIIWILTYPIWWLHEALECF